MHGLFFPGHRIAAAVTGGGNGAMIRSSNDTSPMESSVSGIPTDDPKQNLTKVINSIQKTLGIPQQLYLTVSSFNVASQLLLLLQRILIDDGKNPDKFTQNVLSGCIAKNQTTEGNRFF